MLRVYQDKFDREIIYGHAARQLPMRILFGGAAAFVCHYRHLASHLNRTRNSDISRNWRNRELN